ncbi:tyrosine-type recombinase/integrase [Streptosporangium sp. NPDC051022]|uniref:tyrosine-type recombinase/integrase n=1 Tax=Streptosporangium sp. NPDC051022 TaxID=3155752 RepID=UPI003432EA55
MPGLAEIDKDARVHDARHTAATLLPEQGVDLRVVQVVPGHSQLTTTRRHTHMTETPAVDTAARTERTLFDGFAGHGGRRVFRVSSRS